ncbi:MAG: ilvN [Enterobacter kobei]|nr:ilvN [Enterobacter kobei]
MQHSEHDNVILELTVRNHPGVMTHVCGLFARRAFNVEGEAVRRRVYPYDKRSQKVLELS